MLKPSRCRGRAGPASRRCRCSGAPIGGHMRQHLVYCALTASIITVAAVLVTVLLEPARAGVTLTPLGRMLLMSSTLSLLGGSAWILYAWARWIVERPDRTVSESRRTGGGARSPGSLRSAP